MTHLKSHLLKALILPFLLMTSFGYAAETDPLDTLEVSMAERVAEAMMTVPRTRAARLAAVAASTPPMEKLLVERRPTEKTQPNKRLADVYSYDYTTDETVHVVVDLKTSQLISSERLQNLQLPLNANELQRATDLIFSDPEQSRLMQQEFKRITGNALESPDQLHVKAFTFTKDALPERLNAASQQCGIQRCAQVLLYTHDSIVFEVSPIVNLSAGIVTQTIGF